MTFILEITLNQNTFSGPSWTSEDQDQIQTQKMVHEVWKPNALFLQNKAPSLIWTLIQAYIDTAIWFLMSGSIKWQEFRQLKAVL